MSLLKSIIFRLASSSWEFEIDLKRVEEGNESGGVVTLAQIEQPIEQDEGFPKRRQK